MALEGAASRARSWRRRVATQSCSAFNRRTGSGSFAVMASATDSMLVSSDAGMFATNGATGSRQGHRAASFADPVGVCRRRAGETAHDAQG